jgi:hypothetical protein
MKQFYTSEKIFISDSASSPYAAHTISTVSVVVLQTLKQNFITTQSLFDCTTTQLYCATKNKNVP